MSQQSTWHLADLHCLCVHACINCCCLGLFLKLETAFSNQHPLDHKLVFYWGKKTTTNGAMVLPELWRRYCVKLSTCQILQMQKQKQSLTHLRWCKMRALDVRNQMKACAWRQGVYGLTLNPTDVSQWQQPQQQREPLKFWGRCNPRVKWAKIVSQMNTIL